ncbi:MAG: SpoIIE family protein phosphatase [bacterium]|nr:SpoIIE family protein phosphatase [bacterium]MBK8130782.1 SpoIIE family protein phosphatase [bacterium]
MEPLPNTSSPAPEASGSGVSRSTELLRAFAGLVGLLLVVLLTASVWQEQSGLIRVRFAGTLQGDSEWAVRPNGDSVRVLTRLVATDFLPDPLPAVGDTLIAISGETLTPALYRALFVERILPSDTTIALTYRGARGTVETMGHFRPDPAPTFFMTVVIDALRFLIAFAFLGVGLWAFFAQPNSQQVRVFAWFCFAMVAIMLTTVNVVDPRFATFQIPFRDTVEAILGGLAIGSATFWAHLQLLFPKPLEVCARYGRWLITLIYTPWVGFGVLTVLSSLNIIGETDSIAGVFGLVQVALLLIGFVILGWRYRKSVDRVESRQLRLVLLGTGLGIGGFVGLIFITNLAQDWLRDDPMRLMLMIVVGFLFLLLTPISFAYAFTRYRLLEVQGKLKRGTRYVIAIVAAFLALFGVMYAVGQYTLFGSGISDSPWAMLLVMLFALGVGRISNRLSKILEQQFFPERKQLRERLEGAIERTASIGDSGSFWDDLGTRLQQSLRIQTVQPVLAGENGGQFLLPSREHTPFVLNSDFMARLSRERRPILVDELVASGRSVLSDDEHRWLSGNNVALVLPLITQQRMSGFLALGFKNEEEDYAPEELTLLGNWAPQLAMASENMRLIEENVEKRRLEEQMQMARRIQEGFLPRELPMTIGLEVATHSRFSLEVAGDYFDVLTLPDGETVTAIADVSGKGAGAALLMANLQASLRTAVEAGIPLTRAVAQVNNLIFRNTPPEQYITFVVVSFDPRTSQLRYVNAGHNPPLLVRKDGAVEELPATGLIIGALPNMIYEECSTPFLPGDLLVMYTDGISEAMNDAEEEYGEARLTGLARQLRDQSPARIVAAMEDDVERFCGRIPMEDDSTMVVVKRM